MDVKCHQIAESVVCAVVEVDDTARESVDAEQFEIGEKVLRMRWLPTTNRDGSDEQVHLIDQTGPDRLTREVGPAD